MATAPSQDRRTQAVPRTIPHDCKECGGKAPVLNGAYFRMRRELAKITLNEMVRIARASGFNASRSHLSRMELGEAPFSDKYASLYDSILERRQRSGGESDDWDMD